MTFHRTHLIRLLAAEFIGSIIANLDKKKTPKPVSLDVKITKLEFVSQAVSQAMSFIIEIAVTGEMKFLELRVLVADI